MPFEQSESRDPRHMQKVLDTIMVAWNKYPHLRLGQLIENAIRGESNTFAIRDEDLMHFIHKFGISDTGKI